MTVTRGPLYMFDLHRLIFCFFARSCRAVDEQHDRAAHLSGRVALFTGQEAGQVLKDKRQAGAELEHFKR